ncbi:MAG TPA: beta-propeller fold lactonase family protein [Terriglobia bacterium]
MQIRAWKCRPWHLWVDRAVFLRLGCSLCCLVVLVLPASGSTIVINRDGSRVFVVNSDSDSVSAIDTRTEEKIAEVSVGDDPRALGLSTDGLYLYVTNQGSATLTVLGTEHLTVLATITVGPEPYGVASSPEGLVYVASAAAGEVEVVDPGLAPTTRRICGVWDRFRYGDRYCQRGGVIARIRVGPKPKGLALSPDATRLYVTHFLSGEVSVIDTARRELLQVIPLLLGESNMLQRIVLNSAKGRAYVPHITSNVRNRSLSFDTAISPFVSVIDLASNQEVQLERVYLGLGQTAVNLPFDVALSPDGRRSYVVGLGSGDVTVVDLLTVQKLARIDVGDGPRGIVLSPNGNRAYVANSLSDDVSVINLSTQQEIKRIPVTQSRLAPQVKRGKVLFFSSRSLEISRDRWMSCATCHFEGEHDGRTWLTSLGIRNTTSLRGVSDTRPIHWSADRDEVQDFEFTIRELQQGTGLLRDQFPYRPLGSPNAGLSPDLDALAAYVDTLQPKPNALAHDAAAVERGRAVFDRADVGCARCHVPPRYTDSTLAGSSSPTHNVGTGDGPDERLGPAFDTPSLRALWDSPPYLHDGSAPTLRDVLTARNPGDQHGRTSHLFEAEIADLIAFLRSL